MLSGFKQFILRGNVVDLAVGVVIGAAFGSVVTAFTKDLLTPLIAAIVGKPDFSAINFTINGTPFPVGDFINAAGVVPAGRGGRVFLRGDADQRLDRAHAQGAGAGRSHHQEVPRMPERDSHRRPALRLLHPAAAARAA